MKLFLRIVLSLPIIFWACSKGSDSSQPPPPPISKPPILASTVAGFTGLNKAVITGNITNSGSSAITAKGFCWSKNPNPTLASNFLVSTTSGNTFSDTIRGLWFNTTYYVRAYATNSAGTSYGTEIQLKTENTQYTKGQLFGGGKIFYIDSTGEHGFIYAPFYSYTHYPWAEWPHNYMLVGNTKRDIGEGKANTQKILLSGNNALNTAARICDDYVLNGYDDWFLPSIDELVAIKQTVGFLEMSGSLFWSSTEGNQYQAFLMPINAIASFSSDTKGSYYAVMPVRAF